MSLTATSSSTPVQRFNHESVSVAQQAQRQGADVQEHFSKDTMFAIVEPMTLPQQLQQELAGEDRCQMSVSLLPYRG